MAISDEQPCPTCGRSRGFPPFGRFEVTRDITIPDLTKSVAEELKRMQQYGSQED